MVCTTQTSVEIHNNYPANTTSAGRERRVEEEDWKTSMVCCFYTKDTLENDSDLLFIHQGKIQKQLKLIAEPSLTENMTKNCVYSITFAIVAKSTKVQPADS